MKISILSDCHLGAGHNSGLDDDPFDNFKECLDRSQDCDLILIAGDLFDSRSPRTDVWVRSMSLLSEPLTRPSGVKLVGGNKEVRKIHERTLNSTPVVCLHGNHDRRMRDETNAVQALDSAGMMLHLHLQTAVFEKDGVRVAVHGMSSVPERYSKQVLQQWNPKPMPGCFNILMIHQNVDPYVYTPLEPVNLSVDDMPKGFDLVLNGHIHTRVLDESHGFPFVILGSTVTTQFDKRESENPKGFHKVLLEEGRKPMMDFVPIEGNRRFFYREFSVADAESARREIDAYLEKIASMNLRKQPVVKVKVNGKANSSIDHDLAFLSKKYSGSMVLSIAKKLQEEGMAEKLEFMKNLRDQKMSVEEIGLSLMRSNLKEAGFAGRMDAEDLFRLASESDVDGVIEMATGARK